MRAESLFACSGIVAEQRISVYHCLLVSDAAAVPITNTSETMAQRSDRPAA